MENNVFDGLGDGNLRSVYKAFERQLHRKLAGVFKGDELDKKTHEIVGQVIGKYVKTPEEFDENEANDKIFELADKLIESEIESQKEDARGSFKSVCEDYLKSVYRNFGEQLHKKLSVVFSAGELDEKIRDIVGQVTDDYAKTPEEFDENEANSKIFELADKLIEAEAENQKEDARGSRRVR